MVWLVTAQLWAAFSVQLPMLEIQAPTQKIRNCRFLNAPSDLVMMERGNGLSAANIKGLLSNP